VNDVSDYESEIEKVEEALTQFRQEAHLITSAEEVEALEQDIRQMVNLLGSLMLGYKLQQALDSAPVEQAAQELVDSVPQKMKSEGKKPVHVESGFGYQVTVWTRYYRRNCDQAKKRWHKKKKRHPGLYPELAVLGICERCTPNLASMAGVFAAMLGSFAEAEQVLTALGVPLGEKSIRRLTYRSAQRARMVQQIDGWAGNDKGSGKGRQIIASCDGGRIRLRENKRGRKTKKGRTRYKGAWREPKLLIIYMVDAEGKKIKEYAPLIDGTLQGPDSIFQLLLHYLRQFDIQENDRLLFIADGAPWIWNRVPALLKDLGVKSSQAWQLIDFFHAAQHLHAVARLRKGWNAKQRQRWVTTQRNRLRKGEVKRVISDITKWCRGRNSKAIRTELDYFVKHRHRMVYDQVAALHLPIGSGAVESAIRRVVNLRLKGPAIFWCKGHAEELLMLRSYYKSGRWNQFKKMAFSPLAAVACLA